MSLRLSKTTWAVIALSALFAGYTAVNTRDSTSGEIAAPLERHGQASADAAPRSAAPSSVHPFEHPAARPSRPATADLDVRLAALGRRGQPDDVGPLFGTPPPPPPPPTAADRGPPPPPKAPPFPYRVLGHMEDQGQTTVFLADRGRVVAARLHQIVLGQYRMEQWQENQLVVTYIPLDQRQIVPLGKTP